MPRRIIRQTTEIQTSGAIIITQTIDLTIGDIRRAVIDYFADSFPLTAPGETVSAPEVKFQIPPLRDVIEWPGLRATITRVITRSASTEVSHALRP